MKIWYKIYISSKEHINWQRGGIAIPPLGLCMLCFPEPRVTPESLTALATRAVTPCVSKMHDAIQADAMAGALGGGPPMVTAGAVSAGPPVAMAMHRDALLSPGQLRSDGVRRRILNRGRSSPTTWSLDASANLPPTLWCAGASQVNSLAGELEKLADMKAKGLLDDDEFKAAKAKLLA